MYDSAKSDKNVALSKGHELCNMGMLLFENSGDIKVKQDVILKLNTFVSLYPEEPTILYYMGCAMKKINPDVAFYFFEKSHKLNPHNLDNFIEICNVCLENNCAANILEYNVDGLFDRFLQDLRFKVIFYQSMKGLSCYEALKYTKQIIAHFINNGCKDNNEEEMFISTYAHTSRIYNEISDQENSLKCIANAMKLSDMFDKKSTINEEKTYHFSDLDNLWVDATASASASANASASEAGKNKFISGNVIYNDLKLFIITFYLYYFNFSYVQNDITEELVSKLKKYMPCKYNYSFAERKQKSKIKIAYISSDFIGHAVSNFITPIVSNHNKDNFDVIVFPNNAELTEDMLDLNVPYINIFNMSDNEVADMIYKKQIDILIDLNGHTQGNRLGVFQLNPAPIQMTYLGYPNTTGLDCIKYRITDYVSDPLDTTQYYSEKLLRLPKCFLLYKSVLQKVPSVPKKTRDVIILGSLNKESKINKDVLSCWKKILYRYPNTKLLIKLDYVNDSKNRIDFYMKELEVPKNRLIVLNAYESSHYIKLFTMVDIVLDTFPYCGTTTTCNTLFNSIPMVTLSRPNKHVNNVSASILKHIELDELITYSQEGYIDLVGNLVNDSMKIDEYKATIGEKFKKLMDADSFMPDYESLLKQTYCDNIV